MNLKKILAGAVASVMAVSSFAAVASAEKVDEGKFIIIFADADWKAQIWGRGDDESIDSSYETTADYEGDGTYTISVDLSKGYNVEGFVDEDTGDLLDLTTGNGIAVLGVQIYGEEYASTLCVDIQSVKFDGVEVALNGVSYTNDEDDGRRTNIYNEWAGYDASKTDHVTKDADKATATLINNADIGEWTTIEVTFEVYTVDPPADGEGEGSGEDDGNTDGGDDANTDDGDTDDGNAEETSSTTTTTTTAAEINASGDNTTLFIILGVAAAVVVAVIVVIVIVKKKK